MPKLIYLDSNDFSDLSNPPPKISNDDQNILDFLIGLKKAGHRFALSPIHLSEGVHAAAIHKPSAVRRSLLMKQLCDGNFLIYPTDICKKEICKVKSGHANARLTLDEIMSPEMEWFGTPLTRADFASNRKEIMDKFESTLKRMPRKQRREMKSKLDLSKRSSHKEWRELLSAGRGPSSYEPPLSFLPKDIFVDWLLGIKTDSDIQNALFDIMKDPYVLFSYIVDETDHRATLYSIAHRQGSAWKTALTKLCEKLLSIIPLCDQLNYSLDPKALIQRWMDDGNFITQLIANLDDSQDINVFDKKLVELILSSCPSVATFISVVKSYMFATIDSQLTRARAGNKTVISIKESDFGDMMHCIYSPYVDVFRCDASFGALLKKHSPIKQRIVDRRRALLDFSF